ncbi:MAG: hypothetical protein AAGC68_14160, partial [Verrucomicrobiota bacterium]
NRYDKEADSLALDDPHVSIRSIKRSGENRAHEDPIAAINAASQIPGYDLREAYLNAVCYTWGETKGEEAATWIQENLSGILRADALYFATDGWAESDPGAAAQWLMENTDGSILEDGVWEAVESWGRKDPQAAFEWVSELDEYTAYAVMDGLAEGWGAIEPEAAASAAMGIIDKPYSLEFLSAVASQWSAVDPEAALQWSDEILREDLRGEVLTAIGQQWAHRSPEDAASRVLEIEDAGNRRFAMTGIAIGWSEHDPEGAVEWAIESAEDTNQLQNMVGDIVFNWTLADPQDTAEWLQKAADGPGRDIVVAEFGSSIFNVDPYSAVSWAATISNPELREPLLREMIGEWHSTQGSSALQELEEIELPDGFTLDFLQGSGEGD